MVFDSSSLPPYRATPMRATSGWVLAGLLTISTSAWAQEAWAQEGTPAPKADEAETEQTQVSETETETEVSQPKAEKPKRPDARRSDDLTVELRSVKASSLTNEEKKLNTETMLSKQRIGLSLVTDLTADARARKDIVQLNCVNTKRTQVKGLLKLSQQAASKMYEGMASGEEDVVNHEYTKVAVASQRSQLTVTEAKQCVGEEAIFAGDTTVDVEIDPNIPIDDPTQPAAAPLGPAAPPVASQF